MIIFRTPSWNYHPIYYIWTWTSDIWRVFLLLLFLLASVLIEITLPLSPFAIRWLHSAVCLTKEAWHSEVPSHLNFCVAQDKFMPLISREWRVECWVGPSMRLCKSCLIEFLMMICSIKTSHTILRIECCINSIYTPKYHWSWEAI